MVVVAVALRPSCCPEIEAAGGRQWLTAKMLPTSSRCRTWLLRPWSAGVESTSSKQQVFCDKSFGKGSLEDFKLVLDVHLMGSVNCTRQCGTSCASKITDA